MGQKSFTTGGQFGGADVIFWDCYRLTGPLEILSTLWQPPDRGTTNVKAEGAVIPC